MIKTVSHDSHIKDIKISMYSIHSSTPLPLIQCECIGLYVLMLNIYQHVTHKKFLQLGYGCTKNRPSNIILINFSLIIKVWPYILISGSSVEKQFYKYDSRNPREEGLFDFVPSLKDNTRQWYTLS